MMGWMKEIVTRRQTEVEDAMEKVLEQNNLTFEDLSEEQHDKFYELTKQMAEFTLDVEMSRGRTPYHDS